MPKLNKNEIKKILEDRLKYRMQELHLCSQVSLLKSKTTISTAKLELNDQNRFIYENTRALTDPIFDSGIAMCRVLLEFMGFRVDQNKTFQEKNNYKPDDLKITDLGLKQPTDKQIFDSLKPKEIKALQNTVFLANKGVAHLTRIETKSIDLLDLSIACTVMISIINQHIYIALDYDKVEFE